VAVREPPIAIRGGWVAVREPPIAIRGGWVAVREPPIAIRGGWVTFHSLSGRGGEEINSPPLPSMYPRFTLA